MPGYAGTPPYAMYHPNAFNHYQPQPYMPWAGMPQGQPSNIYPVPPQYHHSRSPSNQSGYSPASMPGASTSRDVQQADGMPPPTMMSRPPPPGQSEAVAGYREVGFFSPSPTTHAVATQGSEPDAARLGDGQARELSFGTIKRTVANKTPSPPIQEADVPEAKIAEQEEEGGEKSFPVFSIGLNAGENGPPRARSKTHPKVVGTSHERGNTAPARLEGSSQQGETSMDSTGGVTEDPVGTVKVIDLTDSVKPTWEFGTTQHDGAEDTRSTDQGAFETPTQPNGAGPVQPPPEPQSTASLIDVAAPLPSISRPPQYIPRMQVPPISVGMPNGVPPFPSHSPSALHPQSSASMVSPSGEYRMTADEWEVKNYGYGFGRVHNGAGLAPPGGRDREYSPRDYSAGKPRRGSYGGYGYDRGSSHERGGFAGRRGRGVSGGFAGRGYSGRNMARGGYPQGQSPRPPFTISQQPMAPPADPGYYAAPPPQGTTYFHPLGYDYAAYPYVPIPPTPVTALTPTSAQAAPPLPMPQSVLSFPLDPTRYYLLGQLEYYLSAQNLAQDFYLKTQMDSRGWISIPLIASFNRVKQLTVDLQLVRDVLMLSSLVEVRGDFVRMRAWQQYVLPAAPPSTVEVTSSESTSDEYTYQSYAHPEFEETGSGTSTSHDEDDDDDEDELSEEEVEFVMGKDQGSWTPERKVPVTATAT
ncbi:hypothetical protein EUX98_g4936 [Antrodiella citrinella]|uniref:HTH La-type RNA-binding domain-containing protein n=1 Tax=Antrodiella citrinella TaxID=2447956 RepID=A0A4S4MVI5_9APHY|nr:hypothetical protein EUX98_g4936 [Antrodiella citrinella]